MKSKLEKTKTEYKMTLYDMFKYSGTKELDQSLKQAKENKPGNAKQATGISSRNASNVPLVSKPSRSCEEHISNFVNSFKTKKRTVKCRI